MRNLLHSREDVLEMVTLRIAMLRESRVMHLSRTRDASDIMQGLEKVSRVAVNKLSAITYLSMADKVERDFWDSSAQNRVRMGDAKPGEEL
jgi:hypothetical protein